jgi:transglutaminase-like putative cysteine protease
MLLFPTSTTAGLLICLGAAALNPAADPGGKSTNPGNAVSFRDALALAARDGQDARPGPRARTFVFTYSTTITGLAPGKMARIWLPVPPSDEDQDVRILQSRGTLHHEQKHGNQILYVESTADTNGSVPLTVIYRATRREVKGEKKETGNTSDELAMYLQPDRMVPVGGKPLDLIKDRELPADQLAAARVLYDVVNNHMRYSKEGKEWGRGDAVWACNSGYGNCSDFHSLFISLARAEKIPANFEIGFPLPPARGSGEITSYHCWAKFHPAGHGWIPVDISEANKNAKLRDYYFGNLTEDRIAFSTGRDLNLVPRQAGPPLNFFIYPYVEVDGKPYPADKIKNKFTFADVPADRPH